MDVNSGLVDPAATAFPNEKDLVGRVAALLYGVACYVVFALTLLYAVGFVSNLVVPKTIDIGRRRRRPRR